MIRKLIRPIIGSHKGHLFLVFANLDLYMTARVLYAMPKGPVDYSELTSKIERCHNSDCIWNTVETHLRRSILCS